MMKVPNSGEVVIPARSERLNSGEAVFFRGF